MRNVIYAIMLISGNGCRVVGVRQWLEDKNRKLWIRGVQERCRSPRDFVITHV